MKSLYNERKLHGESYQDYRRRLKRYAYHKYKNRWTRKKCSYPGCPMGTMTRDVCVRHHDKTIDGRAERRALGMLRRLLGSTRGVSSDVRRAFVEFQRITGGKTPGGKHAGYKWGKDVNKNGERNDYKEARNSS